MHDHGSEDDAVRETSVEDGASVDVAGDRSRPELQILFDLLMANGEFKIAAAVKASLKDIMNNMDAAASASELDELVAKQDYVGAARLKESMKQCAEAATDLPSLSSRSRP